MPTENVALTPVAALPTRSVSSVIDSISLESREMASALRPDGRVTVAAMRGVLEPVVVSADFTRAPASSIASTALEWVSMSRQVAVSLQAGRAHVNTGALVSVDGPVLDRPGDDVRGPRRANPPDDRRARRRPRRR